MGVRVLHRCRLPLFQSRAMSSSPLNPTERPGSVPIIFDSDTLERSLFGKINNWIATRGEFSLPCLPALLESHIERIEQIFALYGIFLTDDNRTQLRAVLQQRLDEGFRASPYSKLQVQYTTPNYPICPATSLSTLTISTVVATMEDKYKHWLRTRTPPLFGAHPDAKVMDSVAEAKHQPTVPLTILDIGAGTGRNTFPLARQGHHVHALEVTPDFAEQMEQEAHHQSLPIKVLRGDIVDPTCQLPLATYDLVLVVEVISHFRNAEQVRSLFQRVSEILKVGGRLVSNAFLPVAGYKPTPLVREMSQFMWSSLFLKEEVDAAIADLPLRLVSDESVYDYEKQHLPADAWPPNGWFENWALGRNILPVQERPPVELRWLVFEKITVF